MPVALTGSCRPLGHVRRGAAAPSADEVLASQQARLYGAMIELVSANGYSGASTRRLADLAHMSKQDMYRHFPCKESYFLATYDVIVAHASERVGAAYAAEGDWRQRLRAAFQALVLEVAEEPKAARLGLVEVLGAGPAGLQRMERTRGLFEAMVGASFADAPGGPPLPPLIVKGIVRGVERIIRQRLLAGRAQELPGLADELLGWALSYHSPATARLAEASCPPAAEIRPRRLRERTADERIALLRIVAQIAAEGGWEQLSAGHIAACAGLSVESVTALCGEDPKRCFLDALRLVSMEALLCAGQAARRAPDRLAGVHRAIAALMDRVARDRALRRLAFVEVFALGPPAIERREALLATFAERLAEQLPRESRPSPLVMEAIVGAIWGILHDHVTRGQTQLLPELSGQVSYLALAPAIGAEDAIRAIRAERGATLSPAT